VHGGQHHHQPDTHTRTQPHTHTQTRSGSVGGRAASACAPQTRPACSRCCAPTTTLARGASACGTAALSHWVRLPLAGVRCVPVHVLGCVAPPSVCVCGGAGMRAHPTTHPKRRHSPPPPNTTTTTPPQ
jgi:hypothetical protein